MFKSEQGDLDNRLPSLETPVAGIEPQSTPNKTNYFLAIATLWSVIINNIITYLM
jgi:hypothetical protein